MSARSIPDLHCSGPVSSMPGSSHALPEGTMCDDHPNVLAVKRIQGETDSMGAEYHCMCQKCVDRMKASAVKHANDPCRCDWCKKTTVHSDIRNRRDVDEGMSGPVYRVCGACCKRDDEALARELEESYRDDYWD